MAQNSGPFLASSYGQPSFHPRLPSSLSKRTSNGPMSIGTSPNTSLGPNMNVSSSPSLMRPSNSIGPIKPGTVGIGSMDKSNSMPYSSRYSRKMWPMSRSIHDKNIRGHEEHEAPYLRTSLPGHSVPPDNVSSSSFTIEPSTDDDESDDIHFSSRHMAAARFQRNQRLLCEVFNEVCIPDLRSNINVDRILTLRRQVDALKTHRETFEKDLNELEEKHVEKKRKFLEANEKFYNEYAEASSTNLSQEKTNEILQKYEAMEKLQKEKQLLLQQQQQQQQQQPVVTSLPPPSTAATSQPTVPPSIKTEPATTIEVLQQQAPPPPPLPPPIQTQFPPSQSVSTQLPASQPVPNQFPTSQPIHTQLPPSQSVQSQVPSSQPVPSQLPSSQPVPSQLPSSQPVPSQLPSSQPVQHQLPPPPSSMQQVQPPQQPQSTPTPQGYPMMHPGSGYPPASGYGHPQQTQYRSTMNQRPTQYPPNVQWQQQQSQQQWQANTYDPRYYNPYPPNVQWSQQQQQWPPNQPQQQQPPPQQMRGPPQQQQQQMYVNGVNYGYSGNTVGWNTSVHPSQSYGYPQNSPYDPSVVSTPPQQQYYPSAQMHNPPQSYDYGPPPPQQQPPQMN